MNLEKYQISRTGKDYAGIYLNLMTSAAIGAALAGAMTALLGLKSNTNLLFFELFVPALNQPTFGIGRILAAVITAFIMIYGTAPFLLSAVAMVVHIDGFNYWAATMSKLSKLISKKELHRSFVETKLFNKFINEAFRLCLIILLKCGVSVQVTSNVVLIALVDKMDFVSFIMVGIMWVAFMTGLAAIIPIAGRMHMYSEEFIDRMRSDRDKEIKRLGSSMETLRIKIGNFFVIKSITYMEIMSVVVDITINVLLAVKYLTKK